MKRIVIMADGKGNRWNNYMGVPKHLALVNGERLIERTVRMLYREKQSYEIIVTSHDNRYEFKGSKRYEPLNNRYEIDRFTEELIIDDMCFLYGDTFYTEDAIKLIMNSSVEDILFFGNQRSIVAVNIKDAELFRKHRIRVRDLYIKGIIKECIGWQVYRSVTDQKLEGDICLDKKFVFIDDITSDLNTPDDYEVIDI